MLRGCSQGNSCQELLDSLLSFIPPPGASCFPPPALAPPHCGQTNVLQHNHLLPGGCFLCREPFSETKGGFLCECSFGAVAQAGVQLRRVTGPHSGRKKQFKFSPLCLGSHPLGLWGCWRPQGSGNSDVKTAFVVRSVIWRMNSLPRTGQGCPAHSGLLSSGGTASPAAGAESKHLNELFQVLGGTGESSSQPGGSLLSHLQPLLAQSNTGLKLLWLYGCGRLIWFE